MKNEDNIIKSEFNENEKFDFRNVPTTFNTVTSSSINRLSRFIKNQNAEVYNNKLSVNAFRNMLKTSSGRFVEAYNTLESNYLARKNNLEQAYEEGITEVEESVLDLEALRNEYNTAYNEYIEIYKKFYDKVPAIGSPFDNVEIVELKKSCDELRTKGAK